MQENDCPICTPWCTTTERQLANRLRNMTKEPGATPYACPRCGSTALGDYADDGRRGENTFVLATPAPKDARGYAMNDKPWETEPDSLVFEADGLNCVMTRNRLGIWCGYVGIDKDHPWFGLPYNTMIKPTPDMLENRSDSDMGAIDFFLTLLSDKNPDEGIQISIALRVHGGITFSDFFPDGLFYYGFDCGHAGDLVPGVSIPENLRLHVEHGVYRDQQFVVSECQQLAAQLARIKKTFEAAAGGSP